ncbi:hypothetical protein OG453_44495 [Streptomyces sp. NBC_01381]|uniref:hypothetical protein n=1 Tax=Streptomyces sp. NBC_01381 TaxID=2903845 RepID=UPI002253D439|nr:hypothetical protein [Streptomyces sp. NBC_01381]MCX4673619.1 hypothetical protein [Streptomyces sp. NBC_01381]
MSISVRGKKLHVASAGGSMDGHVNGTKGRLYSVYKGNRYAVTRWKMAKFASAGMTKFAYVDWKLNKRFYNGEWLCIEFNKANGTPCAKIHR